VTLSGALPGRGLGSVGSADGGATSKPPCYTADKPKLHCFVHRGLSLRERPPRGRPYSRVRGEFLDTWRNWRRELLAAEREAIVSLRDRGDISPEVMRRVQRDLDLEESRIGG